MPVRLHPIAKLPEDDRFASIPLDREVIDRLRSSFAAVSERRQELGRLFYDKLFKVAPNLRSLFKSSLEEQARKLLDTLEAVIRNLESPKENAVMLDELGQRHVAFGALPEHYELVTKLLVESMAEVLGPDADRDTLVEWERAMLLISQRMIAAGGQSND